MDNVIAWDTSIGSENGGDHIIMQACEAVLNEIFPEDFIRHLPTHGWLDQDFVARVVEAKAAIVCGTNLLSSNMKEYAQWKIDKKTAKHIHNAVLLGVGWWQYQNAPDRYTRKILTEVLSKDHIHSVRDMYSGIGWVFDNEEAAIILEDDCLPCVDFFIYCDEMLTRY